MAPRTSLYKFRRAVPEVWFRIVHVALGDVKSLVEYREQTIEVALGPNATFERIHNSRLTRRVPANRVVSAVPEGQRRAKPPGPPKEPRPPRIVETLCKAKEWRRQLDRGEVPNQAAIAYREGVTRARVTQILTLLRLTPDIQKQLLTRSATVSERSLRPIASLDTGHQQAAFSRLLAMRS